MTVDIRHRGVPVTLRDLTQITLILRVAALAAGVLALAETRLSWPVVVSLIVIGVTSYVGLMNTSRLALVRDHPSIALVDTLILAAVVAANGIDSPMILAALTTSFLLGLWLHRAAGLIVLVSLIGLYILAVVQSEHHTFGDRVTIPFVYLSLWILGLTVRTSLERANRVQQMLGQATRSAAIAEERSALARHLHDSLAKSLQGMALMASVLPRQITERPEVATETARELRSMASDAVSHVRGVMTQYRSPEPSLRLDECLTQTAMTWEQRTGRAAHLHPRDMPDVDDATRYELVAVLEEALDNIQRHAGPCRVDIAFGSESGQIELVIADNGRGFSLTDSQLAADAGHHGLAGMRERLARVGGWCDISSQPGKGTTISCSVPILDRIER